MGTLRWQQWPLRGARTGLHPAFHPYPHISNLRGGRPVGSRRRSSWIMASTSCLVELLERKGILTSAEVSHMLEMASSSRPQRPRHPWEIRTWPYRFHILRHSHGGTA